VAKVVAAIAKHKEGQSSEEHRWPWNRAPVAMVAEGERPGGASMAVIGLSARRVG
jgi:hypothetical protein